MMFERFWWFHDTREEKGIFFQAISGSFFYWVLCKYLYLQVFYFLEKEQSPAASSILIFNCPKELYELFVKC